MTGVDDLEFARLGMETEEDGGHIAAARLFALGPVMLIHLRGQISRGMPVTAIARKAERKLMETMAEASPCQLRRQRR